ncbi:MAG: Maf family protein, partial [Myxococcales bacterium]
MTELILASGSPRRRELLAQLGLTPRVLPPDVDETQHAGEAARAYVQRVSREKARQIAARHPGAVVLAADTCVVLDGRVFGKPADASDAAATLKQLSGRTHEVLTAVSVEGAGGAHGALV